MKGTYRKRGSTWTYQVELGKDPLTGKRLQKTKGGFDTKKKAEAACTELISMHNKGHTVSNQRVLMSEFIEQWTDSKKDSISKNTLITYMHHIKNHILPDMGKLEITKIKYTDIQRLQNKLLRDKELSPRSVNDVMKVVRGVLNDAIGKELIYKNPALLVKLPKLDKSKIEVWNDSQVMKFLEVARKDPLYLAFFFPLTTGMRQGEVLGLKKDRVDFKNGTISVEEALDHQGKDLEQSVKTPSSNRSIVMSQTLMVEIKNQLEENERRKKLARELYTENNLVVCTSLGTPVSPRNSLRSLYRLIKKAELPRITYHDLRHTFATILLKSGVHPKIVSEILGHSSIRVTLDTYSHVLPSMQLETAGKIDDLFSHTLVD